MVTILVIFLVVFCILRRKQILKVSDSNDKIEADAQVAGDVEISVVFDALNSTQRLQDQNQSSPA